jgi:hypothetical protein
MDNNKKLELLKKMMGEGGALQGQVLPNESILDQALEEQLDPARPSNMSDVDWKKAKDIAKGNYPKDVEAPVKKVKRENEMLRRIKEAPSHQDFNSKQPKASSLSDVTKAIKAKGGSVVKTVNSAQDLEAARDSVKMALEKQASEAKPGRVSEMANEAYKKAKDLLPEGKFAKLVGKLGKRGLKAVPIVGTGLGLMDAAKAASEGDYKKAGMEALSAIDPTPLTDIYMAGQDIADSMEQEPKPRNLKALQAAGLMAESPRNQVKMRTVQADPSLIKAGLSQEMARDLDTKMKMKANQADPSLQEDVTPMIKELGGEPDMKPGRARGLAGEQESPDLEKMDNVLNYKDYLDQRKKLFGY